jgi:hypothetical protein
MSKLRESLANQRRNIGYDPSTNPAIKALVERPTPSRRTTKAKDDQAARACPVLEPEGRAWADLAARLMATAWFQGKADLCKEAPSKLDRYPGASQRRAVHEAHVLFEECAAAIGLKDNPGNKLTRRDLFFQFTLSDGGGQDPAGMSMVLARLAVQMLSAGTPRAEAVREALELLGASQAEISSCRYHEAPESLAPIPAPPRWPATLKDFYRLIMKVRDKADAQPRLRHYLLGLRYPFHSSQDEEDRRVDDTFRELRTKGFDKPSWLSHARGYRRWWANEVHMKKRRAGRAGYNAKHPQPQAQTKESR